MLAIVDYGMANLRSVQKAFAVLGHEATFVSTPEEVRSADRLVLPGVGAFRDAIATLDKQGISNALRDHVIAGKPLLGICLGLQLLFEIGYEDGEHRGLGLLGGDCVRFTVDQPPLGLKVPHMGWNALQPKVGARLFRGLPPNSFAYFVHSYHVRPTDPGIVACVADYGGPFVAAIEKDNLMATQFHPEKSQRVGQKILDNFASL